MNLSPLNLVSNMEQKQSLVTARTSKGPTRTSKGPVIPAARHHLLCYETLLARFDAWPQDRIRRFVVSSGCVAACGRDGRIMSRAIHDGWNVAMLQFLRSHGAEFVHTRAIVAAVHQNRMNVIAWLVKMYNVADKHMFTAIMMAIRKRNYKIIVILLRWVSAKFFSRKSYRLIIMSAIKDLFTRALSFENADMNHKRKILFRLVHAGVKINPGMMWTEYWNLLIKGNKTKFIEMLLGKGIYSYKRLFHVYSMVIRHSREEIFVVLFHRTKGCHRARGYSPLLITMLRQSNLSFRLYELVVKKLHADHGDLRCIPGHNDLLQLSLQYNVNWIERHLLLVEHGAEGCSEVMLIAIRKRAHMDTFVALISMGVNVSSRKIIPQLMNDEFPPELFSMLIDCGVMLMPRDIIKKGIESMTEQDLCEFSLLLNALVR